MRVSLKRAALGGFAIMLAAITTMTMPAIAVDLGQARVLGAPGLP
jgi:hypothetical protein